MSMVLVSLLSAALTSLLTWVLAWAFYRARLASQLDVLREQLASEVEARVRQGALDAGQELLPEFKQAVTEGFMDAMRGMARGEMAKTFAKTGAEIVGGSLDSLFGQRKRGRFRPW